MVQALVEEMILNRRKDKPYTSPLACRTAVKRLWGECNTPAFPGLNDETVRQRYAGVMIALSSLAERATMAPLSLLIMFT